MRITIQPTTSQAGMPGDCIQHTVVIEHPYDDLTIEVVLTLLEEALEAYGYSLNGMLDVVPQERKKQC